MADCDIVRVCDVDKLHVGVRVELGERLMLKEGVMVTVAEQEGLALCMMLGLGDDEALIE